MTTSNPPTALAALVTVLLLAVLAPSHAGASEIECEIPFSFVVNSRTLPPGHYRVSEMSAGVLYLRDLVHGAFAVNAPISDRHGIRPRLVFHRYGEDYVLRQVWTSATFGRELPEPRLERELRRAALAANPDATPLRVVVDAR